MDIKRNLFVFSTIYAGFTIATECQAQGGGKASYYSNSLHGRRMSNGQPYNRNAFTCAHRTLPFGTQLKVSNPQNGKNVIVTVTDRGPFHKGRVIDLSYAAAKEIGMVASGVAYIKIEILPKQTEIPFPSEENTSQFPEIEYGVAGVCHEFIPEWEEAGKTTQPKKVKRKSTAITPTNASTTTTTQKATPNSEEKKDKNAPKSPITKEENKKQDEKSKSNTWTNFFSKVKNGVTNLFQQ